MPKMMNYFSSKSFHVLKTKTDTCSCEMTLNVIAEINVDDIKQR